MDRIRLDLALPCIVGILPWERIEAQPVEIHLDLQLDLEGCGIRGDLALGVDYGAVDTQIRFLCTEGRFRLIETLAIAILRLILLPPGPGEPRVQVAEATVEIRKPTVLRAATPAVRMHRAAAWADTEVLADVREVEAKRLVVAAGSTLSGPGVAMRLGAACAAVPLPFEVDADTTLLWIDPRD